MESKIELDERVKNKDRKFGSWRTYFPCKVINVNGIEENALFTSDQIEVAIERAKKNPEDVPEKTLWDWLFG